VEKIPINVVPVTSTAEGRQICAEREISEEKKSKVVAFFAVLYYVVLRGME